MRIAVLYSGFIRTWNQCKINQQNNLFTPKTDLFFYTYEKPESFDGKMFVKIPEVYYPHFIDHPYHKNKNPYSSVDSTFNQWHNQYILFCMVPNDYDVYVKCRPDIELSDKINFNDYEINDTNIYIPYGNDHYDGVNDQMAFGSYSVMKKYFSIYTEHRNIFDSGVQFHPEGYITENLKRQGVNIVRLNITNTIIR